MDITANLIRGAWLVFVLYWIFASLSVNRIRKREPAGSRLMRWAAVIVTLVLLNTNFGSSRFSRSAVYSLESLAASGGRCHGVGWHRLCHLGARITLAAIGADRLP